MRPLGEPSLDPRDQLVLEEARRAIDQQKKDLEGLRSRAGATIGFSTVIASVFGGLALRGAGDPTIWTWAAFGVLALTAVTSVYVLAPRKLTLVMNVQKMDGWIDNGDDLAQMTRSTSLGFHEEFNKNERVLLRMHRAYFVSVTALLVEAAFLFVDLARR